MEEQAPERKGIADNWAVREVDHLFSRFARYTRFVLYSKWFLGVFALVLLGSLVIYPMLTKDKSGMRISFISTDTKTGMPTVSPTMENPNFEGVNKRGERFKVIGVRAIQQSPEVTTIEKPEGQLLTQTNSWISLTADRADYDKGKHQLVLTNNVSMIHDKGYTFDTSQAIVDTTTMNVAGGYQISGAGPMGTLLATGFQILDNGNRILFGSQGNRVTVHVEKAKPAA